MSPIFFPLQVVSSFPISSLFLLRRTNIFLFFLLCSFSPPQTKYFPPFSFPFFVFSCTDQILSFKKYAPFNPIQYQETRPKWPRKVREMKWTMGSLACLETRPRVNCAKLLLCSGVLVREREKKKEKETEENVFV